MDKWFFGLKQSYFLLGMSLTAVIGHLQPLVKVLKFEIITLALTTIIFFIALFATIKEERLARPGKKQGGMNG